MKDTPSKNKYNSTSNTFIILNSKIKITIIPNNNNNLSSSNMYLIVLKEVISILILIPTTLIRVVLIQIIKVVVKTETSVPNLNKIIEFH